MNLLRPFPEHAYPQLWEWLNQFPRNNFDDSGPEHYGNFVKSMRQRWEHGETHYAVEHEGERVGFIGFLPVTSRLGFFHGICFAQHVHGKGIAKEAVRRVIEDRFEYGFEKIGASYFADNTRIHRLFQKLGATTEGYMKRHTVRQGQAIDMRLIAFYKGNF